MNELDINRIINQPEILIVILFMTLIFMISFKKKKKKHIPQKNENLEKNHDITILKEYEEKLLALKDLILNELTVFLSRD